MSLGYTRKSSANCWELVSIRPVEEAPGLEYHVAVARSPDVRAIEAAVRLLGIKVLSLDEVYERVGGVVKLG